MHLLDHGYLKLIEGWGSDESIIEAARMSTGKGFLGWGPRHAETCERHHALLQNQLHTGTPCTCDGPKPGDEKLLKYLYDNKHNTPFEMGGLVIEVQAPIFVFREWHRHRTQSYNEMSARYEPLPDVNYIPTVERLMMNAGGTNKQAGTIKGSAALTEEAAAAYRDELALMYLAQERLYQGALKSGIPKELARIHLPVGRYSRMRACANLRNWLAFLTLRMDEAAQSEIREYANAVGVLIKQRFPRTWELFDASRAA